MSNNKSLPYYLLFPWLISSSFITFFRPFLLGICSWLLFFSGCGGKVSVDEDTVDEVLGESITYRVNERGRITENGEEFALRCASWSGWEGRTLDPDFARASGEAPLELYVGNPWWADTGRTIEQTVGELRNIGLNTIRVPVVPQTLNANQKEGIGGRDEGGYLVNHPSVRQKNVLQGLEDFIRTADRYNLKIILDIHSCSNYLSWRAGRLDAEPPFPDAYWSTWDYDREEYSCAGQDESSAYNEARWLENLQSLAGLSQKLGVNNILGITLYETPWGYSWDEWAELAEKGYQVIHKANPNLLAWVGGVGAQTQAGDSTPHGNPITQPSRGENLIGFYNRPLAIPRDQLVLSPIVFGPSVNRLSQFFEGDCAEMEEEDAALDQCLININIKNISQGWHEHFGYLKSLNYAVIIGAFGGNMAWPTTASQRDQILWSHIKEPVDEVWQNTLVDYMLDTSIEGCYWTINPETFNTGGLYQHQYNGGENDNGWGVWGELMPKKLALLKRLWRI